MAHDAVPIQDRIRASAARSAKIAGGAALFVSAIVLSRPRMWQDSGVPFIGVISVSLGVAFATVFVTVFVGFSLGLRSPKEMKRLQKRGEITWSARMLNWGLWALAGAVGAVAYTLGLLLLDSVGIIEV